MLKRAAKKLLQALGYELVRFRAKEPGPEARPDPRYLITEKEQALLRRDLDHFFSRVNGAQSTDHSWAGYDSDEMLGYLSAERLSFYHELLGLCAERGIGFGNKAVADVGTYLGYLPRLILESAPDCWVTGMDLDERSLGLARHLCPSGEFLLDDPFHNPGPYAQRYDIVFCTEVLEHLTEPEASLSALVGLLAPAGTLILTVPNGRADQSEAGNIRDETRKDTSYSGHVHFWSPESWRLFLGRNVPGSHETGVMSSGENFAIIRRQQILATGPTGCQGGTRVLPMKETSP